MASAWAQLSKEEQLAASEKGYVKKSYNDEYGKGGERAPASNLSGQELIDKYTPDAGAAAASESSAQTANRAEAKERSQNHTASASASTQSNQKSSASGSASASKQSNSTSSRPVMSSKMEGYGTEKKYRGPDGGMYTAKQADNAGWTPGYYDEGAGGAELVGKDTRTARERSEDSHWAYQEAQAATQALKQEFGPKNVYGWQSARDTHERHMAQGKPKVTGPAGVEDPYLMAQNEIADELYKTGYDYSGQEMARHANSGSDKSAMNSYLYDEYGGYQNWYDNHSLYSGNFTGSKDLMDFDKVMEIGQQQQDAMRNYQTSDEYMSKYGQYDWAQNYNEKYGQGAN